ncbi:hypothetical protein D3879_25200 [Pseudomonas cavernicola]|uniref:histidine kinase n=1 Tax=Pseudomonas cavernicola TaxID=2320866 RepID=A0A418X9D9_9PSED|nr:hypothetical protein D3879_25200 [Pseudomonas cavernicola]
MTVDNSGPGIAAEGLPHLFERFYRGKQPGTTTGTGLGLAIVRSIMLYHGDHALAESIPDLEARLQLVFPSQH